MARRGPAAAAAAACSKNPFEVKVNREKFPVLGRRVRHAVGLPGVARSRAHAKRQRSLQKEFQQREKCGVFRDRRFGEYDGGMSAEEKAERRFALERQKAFGNKNVYNLNEEEDLTHYGHSLADIEKLNDIVDSDSDAEEKGMLSEELTASHFGGLLSKKKPTEQQNEGGQNPKSRKELVEELIAKSKLEKKERQAQRENTLELTEKLNNDWKEIQALLLQRSSKSETPSQAEEKPKPDEYDVLVRELGFEMKTQPSDRMKTEEELAKEEQEKLQQLEADRLRRMKGEERKESSKKPKHLSADDLADGFLLTKDDRPLLSYGNDMDDEDGEEDSENKESEEESDTESINNPSEGDADEETVLGKRFSKSQKKIKKPNSRRDKEAAQLELPYLFAAPESYEQLQALLLGRTTEEQMDIIARVRKTNHPSLAIGNKAKLEKLFGFLVEYIGELSREGQPRMKTIDELVVVLFELCQMFPKAAGDHMKLLLQEATHSMEEIAERNGLLTFPELDMLLYLKIITVLFPTSDFWHPVVTPSLVYMSQLLTKCAVRTEQDIVKGLFVCCLFLDYTSLAQRFVPELVNFLLGVLHLAIPNKETQGYSLLPPFVSLGKHSNLLVVSEKSGSETWQRQNISLTVLSRSTGKSKIETNNLRLSCVALALALVRRCAVLYGELPSFREIVGPVRLLLSSLMLQATKYPAQLQELHQSVLEKLDVPGTYRPLVCDKRKPVPLKLYTPKIVKVLEFGRKQGSSKQEQERQRLVHKHRRELKGAVREIRRDNQFLAKMQLAEVMERDSERKRKVKQLFQSLAQQEGDWKALKRKKC
ncbi:nucleolar protein 14 [Pseudonaja textilis]|uniref:NOP14 nucleolar protein n=1 Tax=Pseudonaja textilis TaxID=8673 RepID=A0A670ZHG7_PSETE|nr:nucleolar protein 14 [Pseudonaja textilis]